MLPQAPYVRRGLRNRMDLKREERRVASPRPLEVTLDLAEHGKVFIVIRSRALLQVHRLRLAIEQLEAKIELGQNAEAKHLRTALLRGWRGCLGGSGSLQLHRRSLGVRHNRGHCGRRFAGFLEGER